MGRRRVEATGSRRARPSTPAISPLVGHLGLRGPGVPDPQEGTALGRDWFCPRSPSCCGRASSGSMNATAGPRGSSRCPGRPGSRRRRGEPRPTGHRRGRARRSEESVRAAVAPAPDLGPFSGSERSRVIPASAKWDGRRPGRPGMRGCRRERAHDRALGSVGDGGHQSRRPNSAAPSARRVGHGFAPERRAAARGRRRSRPGAAAAIAHPSGRPRCPPARPAAPTYRAQRMTG